ncbi:cytochrome c, mono- and diheme variants family [Bernardetia litoralis DSM 6794]|uniref:Cytochrome c, mono-and diheme variants family n=1 Tax=Bernardetia litoralis (strain ATCC 23117 / DSM 6794 / NBRC 15988 / NCIMB 1366 / Fx l1 / Sio-4) TaxID=880071 RepID=I4ALN4_BERLS|nr:c-type cytochrome [Bernardetia litoralis]AFM04869.1 cytochrome c, mono- and diheme variants family [Bernardetia litoralis DSM 6794]
MLFKQLLIQKSYSDRANQLRSFKRCLKRNVTGSAFCFALMLLVFSTITTLSMQCAYAQDSTAQTTDETVATTDDGAETAGASPEVIAQGKELFEGNCAQCHAVHKKVVGPALNGVESRWPSRAAVTNFIKYPEKVIMGGENEYAAKLYKEYGQMMPNHDFFKDEEIASILDYIKNAPVPVAVVPTNTDTTTTTTGESGAANSGLLLGIVIALVTILLIVAVVLVVLTSVLANYLKREKLNEDEDTVVSQSIFDFKAFFTSSGFIGVVLFILVSVGAKELFAGLWTIGVQQGYAPTQPIKFSHKLHAGLYEIDCKFCHSGVEKGKSAVIPSANVCMNCHGELRRGSPEIQKIYTAIEKNEPIQWVRIHNLPDLSYFNHSQHVKVGGIECETCHGDIKEMEVVQQVSLLTMGWCVNCHREWDVNAKGNDYYDNLIKLHNSTSKEPLKVEDIGGLECSKCHY